MRPVERLVGTVGIHAGQHHQAVLVGRTSQLAVEVAVAQRRRTIVQRELARVVGDDAAGIDDDALDLRPLPVLPPPGDVVAGRVDLGDVRLRPAVRAPIPRDRGNGTVLLLFAVGRRDAAYRGRRGYRLDELASLHAISNLCFTSSGPFLFASLLPTRYLLEPCLSTD